MDMEFQDFGVLGADLSMGMESHFSLEVSSTGYLEDAIAGRSNPRKPQQAQTLDDQVNRFLDITTMENFLSDVYSVQASRNNGVSTSPAESSFYIGMKQEQSHSLACSPQRCMPFSNSSEKDFGMKKIAYPFDMVKRGRIEGHATLEDINLRLVMPPRRPIRHPVGGFAATPCVSAGGFGISGKVVAVTKIHTQGSGTITIIRTSS